MFGSVFSPAFSAATLLSLVPAVLADAQVIPCAVGSGTENGCSSCNDAMGINVTPWSAATADPTFNLPEAASKTGGGYDVWWNINQPDPGCRIILTEPYTTDRGSINGQLSGNVILSVTHGGCYYAHVGSRGVSAGFCCGSGDCGSAGAAPAKKRELPSSRIVRELHPRNTERDISKVQARNNWGGSPNPNDAPAPAPPAVSCTAPTPDGDTYTKSGPQQIDGNTLACNGGESCSLSPSMSVTASDSITNEKSTTLSTTTGVSISMTAGFQLVGPMASVTAGFNTDWTNAVTNAMSESTENSVTKSLTLSIGLVPGANFNLWFTPTLKCQSFKIACNGVDQSIEKCSPVLDGNGNPTGDHGVMTVG